MEYFGVKIGMYFAWLNYYTLALTIPAFFGFFYWLLFQGRNNVSGPFYTLCTCHPALRQKNGISALSYFQFWDDLCFVAFALLNMIWGTVYLEWWKRLQAVYAYRWGTLFMEDDLLVEPRPEFRV